MEKDVKYMERAIALAEYAADLGEIPVGAVIVDNESGDIIAEAYNLRETKKIATAHAEILAIEEACRLRGGWRLSGCTLYVTLEPCPMCAGAIVNSRLDRVVWGADDMLAGCCGSVINFNAYPFNHSFSTTSGVCAEKCREILSNFFERRRLGE